MGYRNGFLISEDGMKEGRKLEVHCECGLQKCFFDLRRQNEGRKERSLYRLMMHEIHLYIYGYVVSDMLRFRYRKKEMFYLMIFKIHFCLRLCGVGHIVKNQM